MNVKSTRKIVDQAFSVPKYVKLGRRSEKSYEFFFKCSLQFQKKSKGDLEPILRWYMLVGTLANL